MLSRNGRFALAFAVLGSLYAFQQPFRQYPGQEYANFPLPPALKAKLAQQTDCFLESKGFNDAAP